MTIRVTGPTLQLTAPPAPASTTAPIPGAFGEALSRLRTRDSLPPPTPSSIPAPLPRTHGHSRTAITEPTLAGAGQQLIARISRGERYVEGVVHRGLHGAPFTPSELLAVQARVYRYTQDLELLSKLVDKATSAARTVLQQNG